MVLGHVVVQGLVMERERVVHVCVVDKALHETLFRLLLLLELSLPLEDLLVRVTGRWLTWRLCKERRIYVEYRVLTAILLDAKTLQVPTSCLIVALRLIALIDARDLNKSRGQLACPDGCVVIVSLS